MFSIIRVLYRLHGRFPARWSWINIASLYLWCYLPLSITSSSLINGNNNNNSINNEVLHPNIPATTQIHSSDVQNPATFSAAREKNKNIRKIILIYKLDVCDQDSQVRRSESVNNSDSNPPTESLMRRSRDLALSQYQQNLRNFVNKNRFLKKNETSYKSPTLIPRNLSSFVVPDNEFPPLQTQYFDVVHMEVMQVPDTLTVADMLSAAQDIPCIEYALNDYTIKTTEVDQNTTFNIYNDSLYNATIDYEEDTNNTLLAELLKPTETSSSWMNDSLVEQFGDVAIPASYSDNDTSLSRDLLRMKLKVSQFVDRFMPTQRKNRKKVIIPDDAMYKAQWYLHGKNIYSIHAEEGWELLHDTGSPVVAIIDMGCDIHHQDLKDNVWKNPHEICDDGVDNDNNGYVDDCYGWDFIEDDNDPSPDHGYHGTAVAGIIGATTHNNKGIASACLNCKIMCLRFMNASTGLISRQIAALNYATRMGAKVSTNSYGGYGRSALEYEIIRRVGEAGHLVITSAGNDNRNLDLQRTAVHTPSSYNLDNIISVGSTTIHGTKQRTSNYGKGSVHIFAPGSKILSLSSGNGYTVYDGTSFATPLVAAVASLVWSQYPCWTYRQVRNVILNSCKSNKAVKDICGCGGIVSLYDALVYASQEKDQECFSRNKPYRTVMRNLEETPSSNRLLVPSTTDTTIRTLHSHLKEKVYHYFKSNDLLLNSTLFKYFNRSSDDLNITRSSQVSPLSMFTKRILRWIPITPLTAFLFVN